MKRGRLIRELVDLLSQIDSALAASDQVEAALRPLERTLSVEEGPIVVAVVGPSGTGKSSIVNTFARGRATEVDIIRPTTRASVAVGIEAGTRLPGVSSWRTDPAPFSDLALVDTPPWEHDREAVTAVLDGADLCLLVVSPDRYADGVVAELREAAHRQGILVVGVLSRVAGPPDVAASVVADATRRLDLGRLLLVAETASGAPIDVSDVAALLESAARQRAPLQEFRRSRAARYCASVLETIAERVEDRARIGDHLSETARVGFAGATVPEPALAVAADGRIGDLVAAVSGAGADAATHIRETWEREPFGDLALARMPDSDDTAGDASEIAEWFDRTSGAATSAMGKPLLRRLRRRAVRSQVWRAAVDRGREPGGSAAFFLGDRLPSVVEDARLDLLATIRARFAARSTAFEQAAASLVEIDPEALRAAMGALVEAYPGVEPPALQDQGAVIDT